MRLASDSIDFNTLSELIKFVSIIVKIIQITCGPLSRQASINFQTWPPSMLVEPGYSAGSPGRNTWSLLGLTRGCVQPLSGYQIFYVYTTKKTPHLIAFLKKRSRIAPSIAALSLPWLLFLALRFLNFLLCTLPWSCHMPSPLSFMNLPVRWLLLRGLCFLCIDL